MALDNAQFISELSITDPPGTDAVAEGDDHIRTTKRATQQSFPNVDAAVPQTAAQMGQMAIKNEVNTFTQTNLFTARQDFGTNIRIDALVGATRGIQWHDQAADERRFDLVYNQINATLNVRRYAAGIQLGNPLSIDEGDGLVSFLEQSPAVVAPTTADVAGLRLRDEAGFTRWFIRRGSTDDGGDLVIRRNSTSGGNQSTPMRFLAASNRINIAEGTILDINNDRLQLRRSAEPSPTARVGHSLRRENNIKMWEIYADNNDDFHMNQRRSVAGAASGTSIKILFASGHIVMAQLPTSAPATSKTLWMSSGFVAITP